MGARFFFEMLGADYTTLSFPPKRKNRFAVVFFGCQ